MIERCRGDILHADVEALVNTVNCVGVMGRGIALQFRNAFPENYSAYQSACRRGEVQPGSMLIVELKRLQNPRYIVNFPTKRHWKGKSRIEDIQSGLVALIGEVIDRGIGSIAIPPLGCGLGGLLWSDVRPLIEQAFAKAPEVRVLLFEPAGAPDPAVMSKAKKSPNMTNGPAALLVLMRRYLAATMDPFVTLLEIHKLMYFVQEAGEDLRLAFVKGHYGPYAENLRHLLSRIEGHFISGYGDAEDNPEKQIEFDSAASDRANAYLARHGETRARFDRVVELIAGFETPFGMELLATVHWVGRHEAVNSPHDAIARVHAWNDRKRAFSARQIQIAWNVLAAKGWLTPESDVVGVSTSN